MSISSPGRPEFGFARTLTSLGGSNTLVIKASRGGGSNALWDKATFETSDDSGHMWGHLRDTVDAALAALTARPGESFRVRGLLYLQGESNSTSDATAAGTRLATLAGNLAAHIDAAHPGTTDGMKIVIGQIAASGSSSARTTTTTAQRNLAAENDAVASAAGATSLVFDTAVPDANGAANGVTGSFTGSYQGFADGAGGQAAAGVLVEGSAGSVVFADYYASLVTSDITGGGDPANANSGTSVTFSFVDPATRAKAAVAGLAFELRAAGGDSLTATFLDADGVVLHETGLLADGRYGYESFDAFTGQAASLIHQVVFEGNAGSLWTLGHAGDTVTADFAYHGLVTVADRRILRRQTCSTVCYSPAVRSKSSTTSPLPEAKSASRVLSEL